MIIVVLVFKSIIVADSVPLDKSKTVTRLVIGKKDVGDKVNKLLNPEKNKAGFAEHNPEDDKKEEPLKDDNKEEPLNVDKPEGPSKADKKEQLLNDDKKEEPLNDDKKEEPSKDDKKEEPLKDVQNNTLSNKDPAPLSKTEENPEKKSPEKPEIENKTEADNKTVTDNKTDNKKNVSSQIKDNLSDKNTNNEEKPSKANSGEPVDDADKKTTLKADDVNKAAKPEDPPLNLDPKNNVKNETTTPNLTSSTTTTTTTATEKPTEAKKSKPASRHVDSDESSSQSDSSQIKTREEGVVSIPSGDSKRFQI
jgi:hypothetical protein